MQSALLDEPGGETIAFNVFISIYLHLGIAGILLHLAPNKHNTRNDN